MVVIRWWGWVLIGLAILAAVASLAAMAAAFWWMADEMDTANASAERAVCVADAVARTPVLPELTSTFKADPSAVLGADKSLVYSSEVSGYDERLTAVEAC